MHIFFKAYEVLSDKMTIITKYLPHVHFEDKN